MITIIYPVAVTDMNFGLIVKAEFEPLTKQQLALKAEGHYLQNQKAPSVSCMRPHHGLKSARMSEIAAFPDIRMHV